MKKDDSKKKQFKPDKTVPEKKRDKNYKNIPVKKLRITSEKFLKRLKFEENINKLSNDIK